MVRVKVPRLNGHSRRLRLTAVHCHRLPARWQVDGCFFVCLTTILGKEIGQKIGRMSHTKKNRNKALTSRLTFGIGGQKNVGIPSALELELSDSELHAKLQRH